MTAFKNRPLTVEAEIIQTDIEVELDLKSMLDVVRAEEIVSYYGPFTLLAHIPLEDVAQYIKMGGMIDAFTIAFRKAKIGEWEDQ